MSIFRQQDRLLYIFIQFFSWNDYRDRRPQHRIGEWIRHDVLRLYREKYHDFNFSHFTDCLKEAEGIDISRSSVVRILTAEGFKSKKSVKRRAKLHRARPRKEAAGMLWQTDASKFEWFGKGKGYARKRDFSVARFAGKRKARLFPIDLN